MSRFHFAKPSSWRVFWSVVATAFLAYVITVVVVYFLAVTTRDSPVSASSKGRVGFLMWDMLFAAPVYVLALWFITIPIILVSGALAAALRRTRRDVEPATGVSKACSR